MKTITPRSFFKYAFLSMFLLAGLIASAQCPPQGDQLSYGNNDWIGYVYVNIGTENPPANPFNADNYSGYVTEPENFDLNLEANPLTGPNLCSDYNYNIQFAIRYKMKKTFVPGYYRIYVGGDDGYRLSIDGGNTYIMDAWTDHGYITDERTIYLEDEVNFVYDFYEQQGLSRVTFSCTAASCSSTAPESITGNTVFSCNNATGATLTATGGTHGAGAQYQWGTGQVIGTNVINGQTGASITVAPSANTYYWVRRVGASPCNGFTDGVVTQVTVSDGGAPGNPAEFGDNVWNVYGYTGNNIDLSQNTYNGYYVQNTLSFETDAFWDRWTSPSTSTAWMGCTVPNDNFTFVHKRKGFPCGQYTLRMNHWDDNTELYLNGVMIWNFAGWSGAAGENERVVGPDGEYTIFEFDANTTIEVRTREFGGAANAQLIVFPINPNTAPSSITGVETVCAGNTVILTAQGGYLGGNSEYQWGTGEPGTNVIEGATTSILSVIVNKSTTYWVRIRKTGCDTFTPAVTHYVFTPAPVVYNGVWSGQPNIDTAVLVESDLVQSQDISACSCRVSNNAKVTIAEGINFTVKGKVTVDEGSDLIFSNKASLLQLENIQNEGRATVIRESSKIKRLDYTIWSSPVEGQQLKAFSPQTVNNRFYEYNTVTNKYNVTDNMLDFALGKGYLIRTPNNHPSDVPTVFTGVFKGVLHNGDITAEMAYGNESASYNATGNPYPSPIRINDFLDANPDIEGTLWFWRKTNDRTQSSYATVNRIGYTANSAPGGENEYAVNPDGVINTGQGFIINAKNTSHLVFNNSMRVGNSTSQFLRNGADNELENLSRVWINITGANDDFSQTLIGYLPQGTNGYDNGLDSHNIDNGSLNVYSIIPNKILAIQGRPEFTASDEVKLGFKSDVAGSFNFVIDHVDGLFAQGQDIFIKDNVTGAMHNLNNGSYTFQSEAGTFNDRFVVVYAQEPVMGTNDNVLSDKDVVIYRSGSQVGVKAPQAIKSVSVYDITGRMVYTANNINALQYTTTGLSTQQQVLIVKAQMDNNQVIEKKFMMK